MLKELKESLNEEAGYKKAAPRAEVMFKMHMAYIASHGRMTNFARALYTWCIGTANQC